MIRTLSPSETRGLSEIQKNYLLNNLLVVSLQPQMLAREALYQTRYGARTIDDAIEMDRHVANTLNLNTQQTLHRPAFDNYSNAEDSQIDRHGISSGLY